MSPMGVPLHSLLLLIFATTPVLADTGSTVVSLLVVLFFLVRVGHDTLAHANTRVRSRPLFRGA